MRYSKNKSTILMIDWLIDYCLTSMEFQLYAGQYHVRQHIITIEMSEKRTIQAKDVWLSQVATKHLVFCSGYTTPTHFQNLQKRYLACRNCDPRNTSYTLWFTFRFSVAWYDNPGVCAEYLRAFEPSEPSLIIIQL